MGPTVKRLEGRGEKVKKRCDVCVFVKKKRKENGDVDLMLSLTLILIAL